MIYWEKPPVWYYSNYLWSWDFSPLKYKCPSENVRHLQIKIMRMGKGHKHLYYFDLVI